MTFSLDLPSIYARMYMAILFGDGGAAAKYNRLQFAGSLKRFFVSGLLNRARGWKCWFVELAWISDQCYVATVSLRPALAEPRLCQSKLATRKLRHLPLMRLQSI